MLYQARFEGLHGYSLATVRRLFLVLVCFVNLRMSLIEQLIKSFDFETLVALDLRVRLELDLGLNDGLGEISTILVVGISIRLLLDITKFWTLQLMRPARG